ncbi:MAG: fatty acid desaturase [Halobacteriovoraceae bacterium]|nr:fatty acid desaturase [Halobacteriovoraceae bacterium]
MQAVKQNQRTEYLKEAHPPKVNLQKIVKPYSKPVEWKSWWQVANTLIPLGLTLVMAYKMLSVSYLASFAFSFLASLFIVRTFIIMHDCGHGSFFKSKKKRDFVGTLTGIICSTPYKQWTREHAAHHQDSGNLDKRGRGDVWTMTLEEYRKASWKEKLGYYLYRHPFITFVIGPIFIFQFRHRITLKTDRPEEKRNVHFTNLALLAIIVGFGSWIGYKNFFMIYAPMLFFGELFGCLLFYVQHQYEDVYWREGKDWNYNVAALEGCSYLKLPKVLQWFSGNIGFHHLHHLNHRVPNYNLEACYEDNEVFQDCTVLTLKDIIPCIRMKVYDEEKGRLLTWKQARVRLAEIQELATKAFQETLSENVAHVSEHVSELKPKARQYSSL